MTDIKSPITTLWRETFIADEEEGPVSGIAIDLPDGSQIWTGDCSNALLDSMGDERPDESGQFLTVAIKGKPTRVVASVASTEDGIALARALASVSATRSDDKPEGGAEGGRKFKDQRAQKAYDLFLREGWMRGDIERFYRSGFAGVARPDEAGSPREAVWLAGRDRAEAGLPHGIPDRPEFRNLIAALSTREEAPAQLSGNPGQLEDRAESEDRLLRRLDGIARGDIFSDEFVSIHATCREAAERIRAQPQVSTAIAQIIAGYRNMDDDGDKDAAIAHLCDLLERVQPQAREEAQPPCWIVGNANSDRWRTWHYGLPAWTDDREQATRYARRQDAEAAHSEDEDAWRVEPYSTTPPAPEAEKLRVAVEALKPFGKVYDNVRSKPGAYIVTGAAGITVSDLRQAAEALAALQQEAQ